MPLPSTAPSPDFNLRPTTFSLEDLKQDSRAVALLVIKDTTNWLAQHKDACTAIKYMIASSAARLLSNKPPCGTALTLAAQDIFKLLLVKYVHRDRGFLPRGDAAQAGCAGDVCARGVCTFELACRGWCARWEGVAVRFRGVLCGCAGLVRSPSRPAARGLRSGGRWMSDIVFRCCF